mmetsp:Transcript_2623/g.5501  ORF Transcript_2623/g.5501 Transcript_2623/m.5501 type:complete len:142 (+) Transcript_2623:1640-2065(+)
MDLEAQQVDPTKSGSYGYSLGFLEDGGRNRRFSILHPFQKNNEYHSRFRQAILGGSGSGSNHTGSSSLGLFACCSENKRRRDDFIQEMRVSLTGDTDMRLATRSFMLWNPTISSLQTTGAVASSPPWDYNCDVSWGSSISC